MDHHHHHQEEDQQQLCDNGSSNILSSVRSAVTHYFFGHDEPQENDDNDEIKIGLKKEQFNLRFQKASGQLENSSKILQVRRDIARIMTAIKAQKRSSINA